MGPDAENEERAGNDLRGHHSACLQALAVIRHGVTFSSILIYVLYLVVNYSSEPWSVRKKDDLMSSGTSVPAVNHHELPTGGFPAAHAAPSLQHGWRQHIAPIARKSAQQPPRIAEHLFQPLWATSWSCHMSPTSLFVGVPRTERQRLPRAARSLVSCSG